MENASFIGYSKQLTQELIDSGKRAADIMNEIMRDNGGWHNLRTRWMAIRLSDGGSDKIIYDSKKDATRHQLHEQQCMYMSFLNLPQGANPRELSVMIKFHRDAYNAGMRLVDPDEQFGGRDLLMTAGIRDFYRGELGI